MGMTTYMLLDGMVHVTLRSITPAWCSRRSLLGKPEGAAKVFGLQNSSSSKMSPYFQVQWSQMPRQLLLCLSKAVCWRTISTLFFMWSLVCIICIQFFSCIGISHMKITGLAFSGENSPLQKPFPGCPQKTTPNLSTVSKLTQPVLSLPCSSFPFWPQRCSE